ncbi:MAG: hypothetical protein WB784_12135 [Rhodanobacteraceae bacterium]
MKARTIHLALAAMLPLIFMLAGTTTFAADEMAAKDAPGTVASTWIMWPKDGQTQQFEAALKTYAAWRKSAGEGWVWSIYQPVVGSDLSFYGVRSGGHHWKDIDSNTAWEASSGAVKKFDTDVAPYMARIEHYFSESDTKHSNWIESKDYKLFSVTSYATKPGTYGERLDALNKIQKAVTDEKWTYPYEISNTIGGKEPLQIVIPMKGYADMADPDPSLMKVLAKSLGSTEAAAATMKEFGSSIDHSNTTIYVYRPDLSTPK